MLVSFVDENLVQPQCAMPRTGDIDSFVEMKQPPAMLRYAGGIGSATNNYISEAVAIAEGRIIFLEMSTLQTQKMGLLATLRILLSQGPVIVPFHHQSVVFSGQVGAPFLGAQPGLLGSFRNDFDVNVRCDWAGSCYTFSDEVSIAYQTTDGTLPDLTRNGSDDLVQMNVLQPAGTPTPPGTPINLVNLRNLVRRETVIEALSILSRALPDVPSIEAGLVYLMDMSAQITVVQTSMSLAATQAFRSRFGEARHVMPSAVRDVSDMLSELARFGSRAGSSSCSDRAIRSAFACEGVRGLFGVISCVRFHDAGCLLSSIAGLRPASLLQDRTPLLDPFNDERQIAHSLVHKTAGTLSGLAQLIENKEMHGRNLWTSTASKLLNWRG